MSRAKAKLAILHDLQCKQPDIILTKKDRDKNLKSIMHYLLDKGRINTTHEDIDKH